MNLQTVERLLAAGFTADEIRGMTQDPASAPAIAPETEPTTDPANAPAIAPETEPAIAPANNDPTPDDNTGKRLDTIESALTALVKTIQQQNLLRDTMPGGNTKTMQQVTDDAMAALIRTPKQQ